MPELPEVETIRRQLEPELVARTVERVDVIDPRWTRPHPPRELIALVTGRRVVSVGRRGKYLLIELGGEIVLAMHLRMTGNVLVGTPTAATAELPPRLGMPRLYESDAGLRHLRARLDLDDGRAIFFTDPRRFGHAIALPAAEMRAYIDQRVGVEPLSPELTPEVIGRLAAGRTAPLKSFLLAQGGIAGIGNIYADEALHRAELHPLSPAGSMRPEHWQALHEGIVAALEAGLAGGGASIDDYRDVRGERGSMQDEFLVHTREGEDCPRCGGEIRRIVVGGRSTYFCPGCQVRLRRRPRRRYATTVR